MSPVDIRQILYDVERIVRADAAAKGVTLQLDVPAVLPPVMGNKTQLIEAAMNLVFLKFLKALQQADARTGKTSSIGMPSTSDEAKTAVSTS